MSLLWQNTTPIYELPPEQQVQVIISISIIVFGLICFGLYYYFKEKDKTVLKNIARSFMILSIVAYIVYFLYICYETGKDINKDSAEAENTVIQQQEEY